MCWCNLTYSGSATILPSRTFIHGGYPAIPLRKAFLEGMLSRCLPVYDDFPSSSGEVCDLSIDVARKVFF